MNVSPRRVDFIEGYHVRLHAALNRGEGRLITLSEGGAYVATPLPLLPQAQLQVKIDIPELERTVEVEAVVAWENRGPARRSPQPDGYGLRFIRVPNVSAEAIRWLLRREDPGAQDPERTHALSPAEVLEAMEQAQARFGSAARSVREPVSSFDAPPGPPYQLQTPIVNVRVPPSTQGVFVLSYDRSFDARVGRADTDLRKSLGEFIGRYSFFHFEVIAARKDRFERECELYHRLGGDRGQLDNEDHPLPPAGPQLKCPVCVKPRA